MARNITIATLVQRVQQRADLENDQRMTTTKLQTILSEMVGEMQLLIAETGMRYFETTATLTLSASIALPSDHLSTIGIDHVTDDAGHRRALTEIMVQERTAVIGQTGDAYYYALVGSTIELYPVPSTGTYKHIYIPQPTDIGTSATNTNVDTISPDGEAFIVYGCAVKALIGAEVDVSMLMAERDAARERLRTWAGARSFITPRRAVRLGDPDLGRDPGDWWPRR